MNRAEYIPVGFLTGTKITCRTPIGEEVEANVETLRAGDFVKTLNNGFVPVRYASFITLSTPYSYDYGCIYKMSDPSLSSDLFVASRQCTLVDNLSEETRLKIVSSEGFYNMADGMDKLPAFLDPRCSTIEQTEDLYVWFFSLEAATDDFTYGIYANRILVESVSLDSFRFIGMSPLGNPQKSSVIPDPNASTSTLS